MPQITLGKPLHEIPDGLFGQNLEITRRTSYGGLSAELLINRKFYAVDAEKNAPKGWQLSGGTIITDCKNESLCGSNFVRLEAGGELAIAQPVYCKPGRSYIFRIWAAADPAQTEAVLDIDVAGCRLSVQLDETPVRCDGDGLTFELVAAGGGGNEAGTETEAGSPVRINCRRGSANVYELSLMPADNYHGMRTDVIALLRELKPSHLRFPGGCCTDHFDWKESLKPASERRPIDGSAKWFLFRDTFDQDTYELGINEFMLLCRAVGASPEYTVRVVLSEPAEAGELVEYCNGGPDTRWGSVREAMGFGPFDLKRWYIGNEVYYFGYEYMNDGVLAAKRCDEYVRAMKAVDPDITLIGGVCGDFHHDQWDRDMFAASQTVYDEISFHGYCGTAIDDEKQDIESLARISSLYRGGDNARLDWVKANIFADSWDNTFINVDEWNLTWGQYGSTLMLLADALTLHFFMRSYDRYHITQARFFHPINEGMIRVTPDAARLDCVGILVKYMNLHRGGRFTEVNIDDPDLDAVATTHAGGRLVISVVNRCSETKVLALPELSVGEPSCAIRFIRLSTPACSGFETRVNVVEERYSSLDIGDLEIGPYETAFVVVT